MRKPLLHILIIFLFAVIAYSNTFNSPFHYDDVGAIVKNPMIKDFDFFADPSRAEAYKHHERGYLVFKQRFFGAFTFAVNYRLHGLDVTGYHIVNFLIHVINALLIYYFVILTFRSPLLQSSTLKDYSVIVAFFAALLFVSHPLHTQAITYIAQRLASLATLFYLLGIISYARARLAKSRGPLIAWYLLALLSAVLGMKTKEITFTLPLAIVLYEYIFMKAKTARRVVYLLPLLLTMLIIPLNYMDLDQSFDKMIDDAGEQTRIAADVSRLSYLFTEFRVIVTYLRLLFLPANQNLDYNYPIYDSFFSPPVFLSFLLLTVLFSSGLYLLFRARRSARKERDSLLGVIAFGIFWFFLTLSVESSIIPLKVIFEHRMYLPSIGISISLCTTLFMIVYHFREKKHVSALVVPSALFLIAVVLTGATYVRNEVWKDEVTLWEDVVRKNPQSADGHLNLGAAYQLRGQLDASIKHYQIAAGLDPDDAITRYNLGFAYESRNLLRNATAQYEHAIKLAPDFSTAYYNLGNVYLRQGRISEAIKQFKSVIRLNPSDRDAYYSLALAYLQGKQFDDAIRYFQITLRSDPNQPDAQANLGVAYLSKGLIDRAIKHLEIASRLNPGSVIARGYLRKAYSMKKQKGHTSP